MQNSQTVFFIEPNIALMVDGNLFNYFSFPIASITKSLCFSPASFQFHAYYIN